MPAEVAAHPPGAGECGAGDQRADAEFEDGDAGLAQVVRAETAGGEAADVRLEAVAIQGEGDLRQLAFRAAQSQFPRHQQDGAFGFDHGGHNVIMKQSDS